MGEYTLGVPRAPKDRRRDLTILLGATIAVIVAGILVAGAILAVTSRGKLPSTKVAQPFGLASDIKKKVREGGPIAMAGLSGDTGFWVGIEDRELVTLPVAQPAPNRCTLRWRGSKDSFTCDDRKIAVADLARFRSFVEPSGPRKGLLMVELRKILPAPTTTTTTP